MSRENSVVRFHHGSSHLRRRVNVERELTLLGEIDRETTLNESAETRSGPSSDGRINHKALETVAGVHQFSDNLHHVVHFLFADGVVSSSEIGSGVFFSGDDIVGMEKVFKHSVSNSVGDGRFEVDLNATGNVLLVFDLLEESSEKFIVFRVRLILEFSVVGETVFGAVQLPSRVSELKTALTDVDAYYLSHGE
jgi:hypothetical protein